MKVPHHLLCNRIVFLCNKPAGKFPVHPMIRHHHDHVFASVIIVEKRGIKAKARNLRGLRPGAHDVLGSHNVVVGIMHIAVIRCDNGIHQIKGSLVVGKTRCPDTVGCPNAPQIQLTHPVKRPGQQMPVYKVTGMMDLHAREPLKGRSGDIIILPDTDDGRVRIEASQNRIVNHERSSSIKTALCAGRTWLPHPCIPCHLPGSGRDTGVER